MSDRDWDAEMRKIDQQLASIPSNASTPVRAQPQGGGGAVPMGRPETTTFGVMARLGLACALGVAIVPWTALGDTLRLTALQIGGAP